jgi:LacI family transcriptional regulator
MPSLTLRDIARHAGVSATTVSKALRNHPKISAARRAEIMALAERLGYRRNPALSAWMRHVREVRRPPAGETLAYVTSRSLAETLRARGAWAHRYHAGALALARQLGFRCTTFALEDHGKDWEQLFRMLHQRGVRGVAIGPLAGLPPPPFADPRFSIAAIESLAPDLPVDWVATDHYTGMLRAIEEARRRGHRRIGYIRSTFTTPEHERWRAAFALHQMDAKETDRVPPLEPGEDGRAEKDLGEWLRRHRPSVIVSPDGSILGRLRRLGVSVPRDLAYITLDQEGAPAGVAGVKQRMEDVGRALVRLLAMKIELNETGPSEVPRSVLLQPLWVDGRTLPQGPGSGVGPGG